MKRWPTKALSEIAEITAGFAWKSSAFSDDAKAGPPIIRIQNLGQNHNAVFAYYSGEIEDGYWVNEGDLLVSLSGSFKVCRWQGPKALLNQRIVVIRPTAELNKNFAFFQISERLREISGAAVGIAVANASMGTVRDMQMSVPSLAEQERIVKLLDEADELRKLRAQADTRTAALLPALFNEMFGDPARNEMGWPVKPFGELVNNQDGRRKPVKASDRAERKGEYPYYGASGIIDYVEEFLFDETALLIGEDGANLLARSTPIAFLAHGKYWVNNHAHVVTDNGNADLNYLCAAMNLRDISDYVTGSAQPKLNQANMNRMPIPVPPLPLQKEFAERVKEIRELEAAQAASRRRTEDLFQSMLHKAFNGEL